MYVEGADHGHHLLAGGEEGGGTEGRLYKWHPGAKGGVREGPVVYGWCVGPHMHVCMRCVSVCLYVSVCMYVIWV